MTDLNPISSVSPCSRVGSAICGPFMVFDPIRTPVPSLAGLRNNKMLHLVDVHGKASYPCGTQPISVGSHCGPQVADPYSFPQECLIARSQREWDGVSIPTDDDCGRGNQARVFIKRPSGPWTRSAGSVTVVQARIAPLRMPDLIGSTIQRRVSSGAMLFRMFNESLRCRRIDVSAYKVFARSEECVLFTLLS